MSASAQASSPSIRTIVVQPTPFCNINCTYCYLPQRSVKSVIAPATVRTLFEKVFASGLAADELSVIWHAGEPLVMPVSFYDEAFAMIEALRPATIRVQHSIQTNGILINEAWCELFHKWHVGVGVSIDGPRRFNDLNRLNRKGRSTFDGTLAGIRLLRARRVPFHVISVLTAASLEAPQEMLEFYLDEGIADVCFNVEESEGSHVSGLFASREPRARFRDFLTRFWQLARANGAVRFIREVDGMLPRVFRPGDGTMRNIQTEPFGMLNVDCHGNVSSFSPELLGLKHADYRDFLIGNVHTHSLEEMRASPVMAAMTRDIAAGVEQCRRECPYFSVCGGGAPVNKLTENGSFASGRTTFCTLTQMVPTDVILESFESLQRHEGYAAAMRAAHAAVDEGEAPLAPPPIGFERLGEAPAARA
jgi:uncharacterized protein